MKNTIRTLFVALIIISTIGCKKILETTPTDFISPENFFTSEAALNSALNGVYDVLGRETLYGGNLWLRFTTSDEGYYARSSQTTGPEVYSYDASNPNLESMWSDFYTGIERANILLENIDKVDISQEAKDEIRGQAKFLRAYYYFVLTDFWGEVPLKLTATKSVTDVNIPQAKLVDIYNFITKEMIEAEAMVKPITAYGFGGRVSQSAVRGVLARVYLKMAGEPLKDVSKYEAAKEWAEKVVTPAIHSLNPNYANIFTNLAGDRYDINESIWEIEFYGNRPGTDFESGRLGNTIGIANTSDDFGYSYGFVNATTKLYNSYEAADKRRDWNVAPFRYTVTAGVVDSINWTTAQINNRNAAKYRRHYEKVLPRNKNYTPINFPLLRYSDVLLMYAEAENEINGPTALAKSLVKQVRDRASASDETTAISTKDDMRTIIKLERFRELPFEAIRKHDLIRWGDFIVNLKEVSNDPTMQAYGKIAGANVTDRDLLLPIPISEISLNRSIKQNKGW